jgi:hypothetical protein
MNADAELDAFLGRQAEVALDEARLHLDRAAHRIDYAAELDDRAVAGAFHDTAVMGGDGRVDQIAPKGAKPCKDAIFVRTSKPGRVRSDGRLQSSDAALSVGRARPSSNRRDLATSDAAHVDYREGRDGANVTLIKAVRRDNFMNVP